VRESVCVRERGAEGVRQRMLWFVVLPLSCVRMCVCVCVWWESGFVSVHVGGRKDTQTYFEQHLLVRVCLYAYVRVYVLVCAGVFEGVGIDMNVCLRVCVHTHKSEEQLLAFWRAATAFVFL